ncbi:hypothetical protein MPNT_170032 [Candidatus Methylacidithermus pantelleriae]|uniref:Uncharacterized protein n=1 Tax=Candidatus Methylacidithermus pantelleriae TaxID=2744239 RepID=A0A8J2BN17_9BACT|nr:hypothetical protein MPNT_170032 [Candidatus Methylacidithermus pantelleriae]
MLFTILASAVYLVNNFWNHEEDRRHASKQPRAVGFGQISLGQGAWASLLLAVLSGIGA